MNKLEKGKKRKERLISSRWKKEHLKRMDIYDHAKFNLLNQQLGCKVVVAVTLKPDECNKAAD